MRRPLLLPLASCLLLVGCGGGSSTSEADSASDSGPSASPSVTATASPEAEGATSDELDGATFAEAVSDGSCDLLTDAEVERLAGGAVDTGVPGTTGGLPDCQWPREQGGFVQVIAASSSEWVRALPEAFRLVEEAGLFQDEKDLDKLREGAALVQSGRAIEPGKACEMFTALLEMQGHSFDEPAVITVVPTEQEPQGVTGQMCRDGLFTSVALLDSAGLTKPVPVDQVEQALLSVHERHRG